MTIARADITGLVLAGGRGSRMGGADKGLQLHRGVPLARLALDRLTPQVGRVAVNANRNLSAYAAFGVAVWPDTLPDRPGPLAGLQAGLARCDTPYLVAVPCDTPHFPADLVERLAAALAARDAEVAVAASREAADAPLRPEPVFCLLSTTVADPLLRAVQGGERRVGHWLAQRRCAVVPFDDAAAFANANTWDELARLPHEPAGATATR